MDEDQVVDDALKFLERLRNQQRNRPIAELASLLIEEIKPPKMAFDSADPQNI
jgi:hypothetical protein